MREGWISTMSPWAPAATAVSDIGRTSDHRPVSCEGSTVTGRWESWRASGTELRSRVKRVEVSNIRMPRSQSTTEPLP